MSYSHLTMDDCVETPFVLDPAAGPFNLFAWVQGGAPGQVIVSQEEGSNWLCADEATGVLRTDLNQAAMGGRSPQPPGPPLVTSAVITDGTWYRVGFVWDGSLRILYVDDVEVARDTQASLAASAGGLYLAMVWLGDLPDQDLNDDGLPDEGREPVFCIPFTALLRRINLMPPCTPTPMPGPGQQ